MLKIYNTLSKTKEQFVVNSKEIKMYVCGITPYDKCHIGHARCYVIFDVIKRYLEYLGFDVKHIQNFTDIDDKIIKEFEIDKGIEFNANTEMSIGDYLEGTLVDVRGRTIGKGFQGAMKRYGFGGLPASHGVSVTHRSLGSTGNRTLPGRVFKGKKMAGHMGDKNICVQNMLVYKVDKDANIIAIKGSIPGKQNAVVYITNAIKKYTENDKVVNGLVCEG